MSGGVFIVLATRDGARFLPAQFDSLLDQTFSEWTVLVRDDGSRDETPEIIGLYAQNDPRVQVLPSADGAGGTAVSNFAYLLETAVAREADYVFCCDQDDIWAPDKLEKMLAALQRVEGPERDPCLVHHDLAVVGEQLEPVADSYWEFMALAPGAERNPERLLSRNEVTGCAMACNRALLKIALPIPEAAIMHDWWLALFAAGFGRLAPIEDTLVSYRQHGGNVIGAKSYRAGLRPARNGLATWRAGNEEFLATVAQARAFREAIPGGDSQHARLRASIEAYCSLPRRGRLARLRALREAHVWRGNLLLNLVLVARMLLLPREPGA